MKTGDILILRDKTARLNGFPPGRRVILREVLFHTLGRGKRLLVELIGEPNQLYTIDDCFLKTIQELRDEKISQILELPPEEIQK
jgi:hypothetical protein